MWFESNWIETKWIELNRIELNRIELNRIELNRIELNRSLYTILTTVCTVPFIVCLEMLLHYFLKRDITIIIIASPSPFISKHWLISTSHIHRNIVLYLSATTVTRKAKIIQTWSIFFKSKVSKQLITLSITMVFFEMMSVRIVPAHLGMNNEWIESIEWINHRILNESIIEDHRSRSSCFVTRKTRWWSKYATQNHFRHSKFETARSWRASWNNFYFVPGLQIFWKTHSTRDIFARKFAR